MRNRILQSFASGAAGGIPAPRRLLALLAFVVVLILPACDGGERPVPVLVNAFKDVTVTSNQPLEFPLPASTKPILVEVLSSEAKLDSRVVLANAEVISRVRFEFLRSVPGFHYVDPVHADNTPRLLVTPIQAPLGASVSVRIYALPDSGNGKGSLNEAWRDMARGQQLVETMDQQAWVPKLSAFESARQKFERLGLEINALWADYLKAFTLYFPLYRYEEAAGGAKLLLEQIDDLEHDGTPPDELQLLRVLTHQLAGQILLEFDARGNRQDEQSQFEAARDHFQAARSLAETAGLQFEETWAINNLGIAYFYEDELDLALEHYALALERSESAQDSYLIALIGSNMAVEQQRRGNINEAVQILQRIEHAPGMKINPMEREHVLGLLGHYYLKLYRFPEALTALNEALYLSDLLESSETRGRNRIKLGRAYREMGQMEKARVLVQQAIEDLEGVQDRRELRKAHRLLANIDRSVGDFEGMQHHRELEAELLEPERDWDRANWLFSRAEDALAQNQDGQAVRDFLVSAAVYDEAGFGAWSDFAILRACAAGITVEHTAGCSVEELGPSYERIREMQASAPALRARFDWVRLLTSRGEQAAALSEARELVYEIQFYRQALPGVLGAWYWDARQEVFKHYLQLILEMPGTAGSSHPEALLALDQLRNSAGTSYFSEQSVAVTEPNTIAAADPASDGDLEGNAGSIRALLALRDQAKTPEESVRVQRLIDAELVMRRQHSAANPVLGTDDFLSQLRGLPADWSIVSYYLAGPVALAWVGDNAGLRLFELGPSPTIRELIDRVINGLNVFNAQSLESDLQALGEAIVGPIQAQLNLNIMVASGGALSELPLEILPMGGRPLIETHQLMHIQSLAMPALSVARAFTGIEPRRLFLAGDPGSSETSGEDLPGTQRELSAISEIFPAAETVIHSQDTLDTGVFRDEAFRSADLVHLASHALIDREYPELSRLILSQGTDGEEIFLAPADIDGIPLAARLIVLSACETVGHNAFEFDSRLGFVTQLVRQSDALVIASLWPVSDRATSEFMQTFYQLLAVSGNVPEALQAAKLLYRRTVGSDNRSWAAFQLFTR